MEARLKESKAKLAAKIRGADRTLRNARSRRQSWESQPVPEVDEQKNPELQGLQEHVEMLKRLRSQIPQGAKHQEYREKMSADIRAAEEQIRWLQPPEDSIPVLEKRLEDMEKKVDRHAELVQEAEDKLAYWTEQRDKAHQELEELKAKATRESEEASPEDGAHGQHSASASLAQWQEAWRQQTEQFQNQLKRQAVAFEQEKVDLATLVAGMASMLTQAGVQVPQEAELQIAKHMAEMKSPTEQSEAPAEQVGFTDVPMEEDNRAASTPSMHDLTPRRRHLLNSSPSLSSTMSMTRRANSGSRCQLTR